MTKVYPVRINKYLAEEKHSTRRGADELISEGRVFINGRLAKLGEMVNEGDLVEVRFRTGKKEKMVYLAYHKPSGVVTHSPGPGEEDINGRVKLTGIFPIGRLDKDSSGLIILTNDGRVTERLLNPIYFHEKEYIVTTKDKLRASFKQKTEGGLKIGDETTRPAKVEILGEREFKIILTEGKNRQIRRMCSVVFQEVETLKRVRVMNIKIGDLKENAWRDIEGEELEVFLRSLEL